MSNAINQEMRRLLQPGAGVMMAGAGNALAARVIESAGFPTMMVSGAAVANHYLGAPDIGLVSLTELVGHVSAIREAINIPILADADTGFGNALNTRRTVKLLERAGANAIMLEDQTYPKRCGHFDGKDVVGKDEMVSKLKAALDAREDPDMMILARTDARAVEGLEGALDRARAYQEIGADFLFVEAPLNKDELFAIPRDVPGIHLCNMVIGGKTPLLPQKELAAGGYAVILYANAALQASTLAMQKVLTKLNAEGSIAGIEDQLMMFAERQVLVNADYYKKLEQSYK